MTTTTPKRGLLLINLGTPDAPTEDSIRRYLKEFLSDPKVVTLPRWIWLPILNNIILRARPARLVGCPILHYVAEGRGHNKTSNTLNPQRTRNRQAGTPVIAPPQPHQHQEKRQPSGH